MEEEIKERFIENSFSSISIEGIINIEDQMKNCICKIKNGRIKGTGFFWKIPINDKDQIPMLITSNHVLNENNIKYRGKIKVSFYNDKIFKEIIIDDDRRIFSDEILDVTFIEINIKKDNINNFLELDEKVNYDKNNLNDIYSSKPI